MLMCRLDPLKVRISRRGFLRTYWRVEKLMLQLRSTLYAYNLFMRKSLGEKLDFYRNFKTISLFFFHC